MPTPSIPQVERLRANIQALIHDLMTTNSLAVHKRIDQSWYMQKATELSLIESQVTDAQKKLENASARMEKNYREIFCQWQEDIRWLNRPPGATLPDPKR